MDEPLESSPVEESSGQDSLRSALETAYSESEATTPAAPAAPASEVAPATADPAPTASAAPVPSPGAEPAIPGRLQGKWKDRWAALDPEVKAEFLRYESDTGRLASTYGQAAKAWNEVQRVLSPYMDMIQAERGTVPGAISNLFQTARLLRHGTVDQKLALVRSMVQTYGIPAQVSQDGFLHIGQPRTDPATLGRLTQLEAQDLTSRADLTHNMREQVRSELDTFCADPSHSNVAHPGYMELMANLISTGTAKDLAEAYEKAAWLHDSTRDLAIARANQAKVQPGIQQAAAAKAAAVSVAGNAPGTPTMDYSKMTLRDELSRRFEESSS